MESIICPHCSSKLNSNQPIPRNQLLVCAKCGYKGYHASFKLPDHSGTEILNPQQAAVLLKGQLRLQNGSQMFELIIGENTFGRNTAYAKVMHGIETEDTLMSRKHFSVEVVFNKSALRFDHLLRDAGSKNGTFLNEQRVLPNDVVLLQSGNVVRAGATKLIFEIQDADDTEVAKNKYTSV